MPVLLKQYIMQHGIRYKRSGTRKPKRKKKRRETYRRRKRRSIWTKTRRRRYDYFITSRFLVASRRHVHVYRL